MNGRKRVLGVLLGVVGLGVIAGLAVFAWIFFGPNTFEGPSVREVYVSRGQALPSVVDSLENRGIIRSRSGFVFVAKILGGASGIKIGKYVVRSGISNYRLYQMLVSGRDAELIRVRIPEGSFARVQARIFARTLGSDSTKYMQLVSNPVLAGSLGAPTLEGYLLPDSYEFSWNQDERDIIRAMVDSFKEFYTDSLRRRTEELRWTTREMLTMASIIEGEVKLPEERWMVSGVYHNRLRKRMYLQADPTIQYILKDGPRRLLYEDLQIDDPYNTYRHTGLPPGPVNNPGRAAILAALYPQMHNYLYFVANGTGGHRFASTYETHLRNVRMYRRARALTNSASRSSEGSSR